jgi:hypothetical protein
MPYYVSEPPLLRYIGLIRDSGRDMGGKHLDGDILSLLLTILVIAIIHLACTSLVYIPTRTDSSTQAIVSLSVNIISPYQGELAPPRNRHAYLLISRWLFNRSSE